MHILQNKILWPLTVTSYRLGVAGFMTSKELRSAGYKANNGFHDQRTALQWIKKYIGGFGGDPDEITVSGESAGGCMYFPMTGGKSLRRQFLPSCY